MDTLLSVMAAITVVVFIKAIVDIRIGKRNISQIHTLANVFLGGIALMFSMQL